jgi:hypothetical protein
MVALLGTLLALYTFVALLAFSDLQVLALAIYELDITLAGCSTLNADYVLYAKSDGSVAVNFFRY